MTGRDKITGSDGVSASELEAELRRRTEALSRSLEQQEAMSEILQATAETRGEVGPVFEGIATWANRLIGGLSTAVFTIVDDSLRLEAFTPVSPQADAALQAAFPLPLARSPAWASIRNGSTFVCHDVEQDWSNSPQMVEMARLRGFRSILYAPIMLAGQAIGTISVTRVQPGEFHESHVKLLQMFAAQAVIAIENARLVKETREALERQTATADALKAISSNVLDLDLVLQTLLRSAIRLCGAVVGQIYKREGDVHRSIAQSANTLPEYMEHEQRTDVRAGRGTLIGRVALEGRTVMIEDAWTDPEYVEKDAARIGMVRAMLGVPLYREGEQIGAFALARDVPGPFTQRQIELVTTFADQAVIAMENARLFREVQDRTEDLHESLQQQTATADVLKVISRSAFDLSTVLNALTVSAARLCDADMAAMIRQDADGNYFHAAQYGFPAAWSTIIADTRLQPGRGSVVGRALLESKPVQIVDVLADPEYEYRDQQAAARFRTLLGVPLLRSGQPVGVLILGRTTVRSFTSRQVDLVTTFSDQAVIAIENVRLFDEVQDRTRELAEALTYQTGSASILNVIASSPTDVGPVLRAIVETACEVCDAYDAALLLKDGDHLRFSAHHGPIPIGLEKWPINRRWTAGRAFVDQKPVHIADLSDAAHSDLSDGRQLAIKMGHRSILSVPLLRENEGIGAIVLRRTERQPFSERQINLLQTFADQAVIALGNARLFEELKSRTEELRESLQQQTATAEVLKVISRSAFDLGAVLQTLVESAAQLVGANKGTIARKRDGSFFREAFYGFTEEFRRKIAHIPIIPERGSASGRALLESKTIHIPDIHSDPDYTLLETLQLDEFSAILGVPMFRDSEPIGVFALTRDEPGPFTEKEIELVTTFADQAAIAIENVRLFEQVQQRTRELSKSLDDLRSAQDRLVQTEKLASLGQLTAGIAHEIKNPLNFVNNFSALSTDLIDELGDVLGKMSLDAKAREEIDELTQMLKSNLEKIEQHGRRADSIVKNMLLHSREGSGEQRSTNINALVDEALNLAYHGARAEKPGFNVALDREFDPAAGEANLYPQEITRVLLNLISNGFYAGAKRKEEYGEGFEPALLATTKDLGGSVEIRIRDNGVGIPPDVKERMFNPFFTTKPPGEGTGLGLSMSHDIVVKQHGGTIDVVTEPGKFTEFVLTLPRARSH